MTEPSQYTECWLMLATLDEDWDSADCRLAKLNNRERAALYRAITAIKFALINGRFDRFDSPEVLPRAIAKIEGDS